MTPRTLADCRFTTGYTSARMLRRTHWSRAVIALVDCCLIGWLLYRSI
jgi:hypothetical protein